MEEYTAHTSVLLREAVDILAIKPSGIYVDATFGGGGHSAAILEKLGPDGRLIAFDRDPEAIAHGQDLLNNSAGRLTLVNDNFSSLKEHLAAMNILKVDGILADLGVSTHQLLAEERGFSAKNNGFLDMRMGPDAAMSAADLLRTIDEYQLATLFMAVDEKPREARLLAREMKKLAGERPELTTGELAELIQKISMPHPGKKDPTKRIFLALRMAVNGELEAIDTLLAKAPSCLKIGGRLAVISFHSLEDRHVKQGLRRLTVNCTCPPKQPVCTCGGKPMARLLTKKGILPGEEELLNNHRARSATLRAVEMLREVP